MGELVVSVSVVTCKGERRQYRVENGENLSVGEVYGKVKGLSSDDVILLSVRPDLTGKVFKVGK